MRTIFTNQDIKNYIETIFNGNFAMFKASNGQIPYSNPNSEKIALLDTDNGLEEFVDLAQYLNIKFYSWKERLVEKGDHVYGESSLMPFDSWVDSLNLSLKESYALVEKIDEEVAMSQDLDSATILGKITFLIQADKVSNLDYYITKLKNIYLGNPQEIQNSYGDTIKAFVTLGSLIYDQEPITTQLGECFVVTSNFKITYLADAKTFSDIKVEMSLEGDNNWSEETQTGYLEMPLTKVTLQRLFNTTPLPKYNRPDITGYVSSAVGNTETYTFYDYNKKLSKKLDDLFWRFGAIKIDDVATTIQEPSVPLYIRVTTNGHKYVYRQIIDNMQKSLSNNDFNICSISVKGYGKN